MEDPGLDLHGWESEWEALEPQLEDSPREALPELERLVGRMLRESGFEPDVEDPAGDDEIVAEYREARRVARLVDDGGDVGPGDVGAAVQGLRNAGRALRARQAGL